MFDMTINFILKLLFSKDYPSRVNRIFYYIFSVLTAILSVLFLLFEKSKFNNISFCIVCGMSSLILWPKIKFNWHIRASALYIVMRSLSTYSPS